MFRDSSALVPLLLAEQRSAALTALLAGDKEATIWWATPLEFQSAIRAIRVVETIPESPAAAGDVVSTTPLESSRRRAERDHD
jgi:hypothetical protein